MSLIFVKFLAFLALSACVSSAITKKPCCFSKQFFAKLTIVTGTPKILNGNLIAEFTKNEFDLDYDRDMKRERAVGNFTKGYGPTKFTTSYKAWNDYTSGKRYAMDSNSGWNCTVTPLPQSEMAQSVNCVPDTLLWQGSSVLGSGSDAVNVDSWEGMVQKLRYTFVTTANDCTPVSVTRSGQTLDGTRFVDITHYSNFTQGRVSQTSALDIPNEC